MSKLLITGSEGFIAYHLREALSAYDLILMDRKSGGDILDEEYLHNVFENNNFDTVFHFAANSDISTGDPMIELRDTFTTTFRLLEMCRRCGVKRFVFASSSAVYGITPDMLMETYGPLKPVSHYGAMKLASEAIISAYSHLYGIQAYVLRFPNVIGPHATHGVLFDLIRKIKANPLYLEVKGDGSQLKPYIHVMELVEAVLFVWRNAKELYNDYNISSIGRTSVASIVDIIVRRGGVRTRVEYTGGRTGWQGDCPEYKYNIQKLIYLGWQPLMESNVAVERAINEIWEEV